MNKKIVISLAVIGAVAAIAVGGTIAFFSDTETSTGNTFTAGAIDLKVDNESYVTGPNGQLMASPNTSWTLSDLTGQLFFNFSDLKPGDIGEDTISLHVDSNDAWLCAAAQITDDSDQTCTEPELQDDSSCVAPNGVGELAENLHFAFWADDGDNVYEDNETIFLRGSIKDLGLAGQIALVDAGHNVWGQGGALPGGITKYIGKAWCFGTLEEIPMQPGENLSPLNGTGFNCHGESVNNAAQSDRVMGNIQFYAVQARNNSSFSCSSYNPNWVQTLTLILENKDAIWDVIDETGSPEIQGTLTYKTQGNTFDYTFQATGLTPSTNYSLIYYADKDPRFQYWGGDNPGALIDTFTTDVSGNILIAAVANVELGIDLPESPDWNINPVPNYCDNNNTYDDYNTCAGAKIWLVPSTDYDAAAKKVTVWNPTAFLFETDLINYNDTNN